MSSVLDQKNKCETKLGTCERDNKDLKADHKLALDRSDRMCENLNKGCQDKLNTKTKEARLNKNRISNVKDTYNDLKEKHDTCEQ